MKPPILILVAALAAAPTAAITASLVSPSPVQGDESSESLESIRAAIGRLSDRLAEVQAQQQELATSIETKQWSAYSPPSASQRIPEGKIEAVVNEFLAQRGQEILVAPATLEEEAPFEAAAAVDHLLSLEDSWDTGDMERELYWKELRDKGQIDAVIAELERRADLDPESPDAHMQLGEAYFQKIQDVAGGPLAGVWASKADAQMDRVLEIDENHWQARFTKAVGLSFWPPFLGKQPEAIRQFEILIDKQGSAEPHAGHAQTYLVLGNLYAQNGQNDKAIEVWNQGAAAHPDFADFQQQIDLVTGE